jgi:hypothetical protein
MKMDHTLLLYLRSALNKWLLAGAVVTAVSGALFSGPMGRLLIPLTSIAGYLAVTVLMLQSRRGAGAIIAEGEEDRVKETLAAIRSSAAERDRIAVLRIADEKVRKAVEYFLQVSGEYIEECKRQSTYSPEGSDRIREVLALLQIHLERLDGASTDEEYGLKDQSAARSSRDASATETVGRIHEAAAFVRERMASELAVLAAQDRLEIMDEMEGKR